MAYTGDTTPDTRELPELTITKLSVGPMDNNAYVLRCTSTGEQLMIDAANEPGRLRDLIGEGGLATVVTTHRHADHWQGLADVVAATGAESLAHPADAPSLPVVTRTVDEGAAVRVGDVSLEVIHLVGHTPGSIALLYRDPAGHPHLWTGDSLFPGGPGRTTNPTDFNSLMDDLEAKIFGPLPDDTWFYPGHGKDSTLGAERPHLGEWRDRGW
ncbi:MAG TPA: MBL fold metallo-hydrolase [Micromonosporaceae bacterium]|jgi:Zn-dependent hydrolases, including glyoxylases